MGVAPVINSKLHVTSFRTSITFGPLEGQGSEFNFQPCEMVYSFIIIPFISLSPSDVSVPNDTSPVKNKDIVEFVHVKTEKLLNSHDVAAPLTPANQEIAGYINYSAKFVPYLEWRMVCQTNHTH